MDTLRLRSSSGGEIAFIVALKTFDFNLETIKIIARVIHQEDIIVRHLKYLMKVQENYFAFCK